MNENQVKKVMSKAGANLLVEFAIELTKQGHRATGSLINSLKFSVVPIIDGIQLSIYSHKYGIYVDKGVRADRIKKPFAPPRINALMKWIKTKGMASSAKQIRSLAYAIAWTHKNVVWSGEGFGMPTSRAMTKSRTGKRTGWIGTTVENSKQEIINKLTSDYSRELSLSFDNIIRRQRETLKMIQK